MSGRNHSIYCFPAVFPGSPVVSSQACRGHYLAEPSRELCRYWALSYSMPQILVTSASLNAHICLLSWVRLGLFGSTSLCSYLEAPLGTKLEWLAVSSLRDPFFKVHCLLPDVWKLLCIVFSICLRWQDDSSIVNHLRKSESFEKNG